MLRPKRRDPRPIGGGVCELDLTRGFVALIDEADAELVSVCNWYASFNGHQPYPYVKGKLPGGKSPVRLHRYLMGFPSDAVDHINQITTDNRRCNLRLATGTLNNANTSVRRDSQVGLKGVRRNGRKFVAYIKANGVRQYLGTFATAIEAAAAYDRAALATFGDFARPNFA